MPVKERMNTRAMMITSVDVSKEYDISTNTVEDLKGATMEDRIQRFKSYD